MSAVRRPTTAMVLRSCVYAVWLIGSMVIEGVACLPLLLGPREWTMAILRSWAALQIWGLRHLAGVR